jgi:hypothetical protein
MFFEYAINETLFKTKNLLNPTHFKTYNKIARAVNHIVYL